MLDSSATATAPEQPPAAAGRRPLASPRYIACLLLLSLTAIGTRLAATTLEAYFEKRPLPLKLKLYRMNATRLLPYRLAVQQPQPLPAETIETLGTEDYLNWILVDPRLDPTDPAYAARLFITYYTGKPDMVPHEPRECMQAAGWRLVAETALTMDLPDPLGGATAAPVAMLSFEPPSSAPAPAEERPRLNVMYFFNANGKYRTDRTGVRLAVSSLSDRYAYYTKVEISFTNERGTDFADAAQSEAALRRLLPTLMGVLWSDHLPDWAAARSAPAAANEQ